MHATLGAFPEPARRGAGRRIGGLAGVIGVRRSTAEAHIAASFPDRPRTWVLETLRQCYRHFGAELGMLAGGTPAVRSALDRARAPDAATELLGELEMSRRGAVIVTGHLGNWELGAAWIASSGRAVTTVARRHGVEWDGRLRVVRRELGIETLSHGEHPRRLARALRNGGIVALVADQHAPRGGVRTPFMGRPAWTSLGPARLSRAAGVPLFFGAVTRESGEYAVDFRRVDVVEHDDGDAALTRAWLSALERAIVSRPEQYLWFHRKWKDRGGRGVRNDAPREWYQRPDDGDEAIIDLHRNTGS